MINKLLLAMGIKIPRSMEEYKLFIDLGYECCVKFCTYIQIVSKYHENNIEILNIAEIKDYLYSVRVHLPFHNIFWRSPSECNSECIFNNGKCILGINFKDCIYAVDDN